jgi:aspartate kinase
MFTVLGREGINIDMISTSEIKISCAVKKREGKRAVRVIHREFELDKEADT